LLREQKKDEEWVEVLSWKPRAFLYHNFLTEEEADHVINLAGDKIQRSQVVSQNSGSQVSTARTSSGVFVMGEDRQDPIIQVPKGGSSSSSLWQKLEAKIAKWTQIPAENGEAFYLLR
jgi:prolyl 4-hydroxylase